MRKCEADDIARRRRSNEAIKVESFNPDISLSACAAGKGNVGAAAPSTTSIQVATSADRISNEANGAARATATTRIAYGAIPAPGRDASADRNAPRAGDKNSAATAARCTTSIVADRCATAATGSANQGNDGNRAKALPGLPSVPAYLSCTRSSIRSKASTAATAGVD